MRFDKFDAAIFISPNAVERGMAVIRAGVRARFAAMVAIGGASARALRQHGVTSVVVPRSDRTAKRCSSCQLTDVRGKRIAIFRGEGGAHCSVHARSARCNRRDAECYGARIRR